MAAINTPKHVHFLRIDANFELTFDRKLEHADKDLERKHDVFDSKNFRVDH